MVNDDNIPHVLHYTGLWGAVANIFIMAEKQYVHLNRDICQRNVLQRTDDAIQPDSYWIAIPGTQTDTTTHSPPPMQIDLKMQDGGKNENRGEKRKKNVLHTVKGRGARGVSRGGEILSCGNRSHTEGAGDKMDLIQREGQKKIKAA